MSDNSSRPSEDDKAYFAAVSMEDENEYPGVALDNIVQRDDIDGQLALRNLERRRQEKRRKKLITLGVAGALIAAIVIAVVAGKGLMGGEEPETEYIPETAVVERTNFQSTVNASGTLKAGSTVVVVPEVDGTIESIKVTEGQEVKEGDVLFTLKNEELDKAVQTAQSAVDEAERDLTRAQAAVDSAVAARDEAWDRYREEWEAADAKHAAWQQAKNNYDSRYKAWEEDYAAYRDALDKANQLKCSEPTPIDPYTGDDEAKKQEYERQYAQYLVDYETWKDYQEALSQVPAEPVAPEEPGEEPTYPTEPDDTSLTAEIDSAKDALTKADEAVSKAKEEYDQAVEKADKRTVKAPSAGSVVAINATVGESITAGSGGSSEGSGDAGLGVVQISDIKQMAVDIEVNEIDVLSLKKGQSAIVTFSAVPDVECKATVTSVAKAASGGTDGMGGIVTFRVGLVIPMPDEALRPGMTANVRILTVDMKDVLVVPTSAVFDSGVGNSVEVVVDEETMQTETRLVKVGASSSTDTVIEEGLVEGETVLLTGGMSSEGSASFMMGGEG